MEFTLCALVVESHSAEILLVDAHIFNDVIYPGADLRYSMEVSPSCAMRSKNRGKEEKQKT